MPSEIIALAQDVADDVGLQRPISLFNAYDEGDDTPRRLLRAIHRTARFLSQYRAWSETRREHTLVSVANGLQTGGLPATLFRRMIPNTLFDRTNQARIEGPVTPDVWQHRIARNLTYGVPIAMIRQGGLYLSSPFAVGATIAYEYHSTIIGTTSESVALERFGSDTDIPIWDDELMHLGMVWHVMNRDGQATGTDYEAFETALRDRVNADAYHGTLTMGGLADQGWYDPTILDGSWVVS